MSTVVYSPEAIRLNSLLFPGMQRYGRQANVLVNGEEFSISVGYTRTYISGDDHSAVIVVPRKTVEGLRNLTEADVLYILRELKNVQELY